VIVFVAFLRRLRDPVTWASVSQLLKTAAAVVIAWVLSVRVFHVAQPFLAPWAALLTVHATVFGTLRRGLQQAAASVLGVLFAFGAGHLFGVNALSLSAAVLCGLIVGSLRGLRAETTTAAATALVVLTTGYGDNGGMLVGRLLDTGIGIAVGLLVNLLVWPPLRDRGAARQINAIGEKIGALLGDIALQLQEGSDRPEAEAWIASSDELDDDIDRAWKILEQARESGRMNPRPAAHVRMRAADGFGDILTRLAQAVAETRSMARTIGLARTPPSQWDPRFRQPWLELLRRAGATAASADVDALRAARDDLEAFADELPVGELPDGFWPVTGALLVNLRNILEALDIVTEARPVEVPASTLSFA
jgi:uncharacterized membrane protein YccC